MKEGFLKGYYSMLRKLPLKQCDSLGFPICHPFISRVKKPWEYLEMEEYIERYGTHPPQKTRKTCIRGKKIAGNPCLICRDQKLHVDYRNLKLLEQFICSHMCVIFHPTRTGVCMKQHKRLTQTINQARDHGLLSFHIPLVTLQGKDYTNQYQAVTKMPPTPSMQSQTPWYLWYEW
uniref:Small ribosomal subunit protein mS40 n=1 Tax=Chelonoidis abingdonii TaxID=106734 RepID=A0A8C0IMW9_CHEAB